MSEKTKSQQPLLYIHQPEFVPPEASMQNTYSARRTVKKYDVKQTVEQTADDQTDTLINISETKEKVNEDLLNKAAENEIVNGETEENSKIIEIVEDKELLEEEKEEPVSTYNETVLDKNKSKKVIPEYEEKWNAEKATIAEREKEKIKKKIQYGIRSVKKFIDMNLDEKIEYLTNTPKPIPSVACIFKTKEKTYRGFLVGKTEEALNVKLYNNKKQTIKITDLIDINMIGR